jgi:hypothetical protein
LNVLRLQEYLQANSKVVMLIKLSLKTLNWRAELNTCTWCLLRTCSSFESAELRLSQRWSCRWGCGGTLGLVPLVVEVASRDRTEDYQQPRVLKPPNVRFACVEIRALLCVHQRLQNRGSGRTIGHLWGKCRVFTLAALRRTWVLSTVAGTTARHLLRPG